MGSLSAEYLHEIKLRMLRGVIVGIQRDGTFFIGWGMVNKTIEEGEIAKNLLHLRFMPCILLHGQMISFSCGLLFVQLPLQAAVSAGCYNILLEICGDLLESPEEMKYFVFAISQQGFDFFLILAANR